MYATVAFTLTILGIFSIIELIKGNQKFSLLKYYMLSVIILLTISSGLDYLDLTNHPNPYYKPITRFFGTVVFVNIFCIIVLKKIPKAVYIIEGFLLIFFLITIFNGFEFPRLINNQLQQDYYTYQVIFFSLSSLFFLSLIIYTFIKLVSNTSNKNLYDINIRNWTFGLYFAIFLLLLTLLLLYVLYLNGIKTGYDDSIIILFIFRFYILLFILFRPKFLDDDKYARSFNQLIARNKGVTFNNFEFLFYSNNYYLNPEANIDDLALKLNATKNEVADFLKNEIDENFIELLNKNRVEYLKELLKAKKYESFTIEALSEMSGFNNRRSMYNSFNKYVGVTPTEFIISVK
jgi:AraC-like DNA-binding protein